MVLLLVMWLVLKLEAIAWHSTHQETSSITTTMTPCINYPQSYELEEELLNI